MTVEERYSITFWAPSAAYEPTMMRLSDACEFGVWLTRIARCGYHFVTEFAGKTLTNRPDVKQEVTAAV